MAGGFSNNLNKKLGFSLIEMLVVVAIMVIMTGVLLANLPKFRDQTSLDLVAQDVAITIRQAQVYGVGNKQTAGGQFGAYGIHVGTSDNKAITLFSDFPVGNTKDGNGVYDPGSVCGQPGTECVDQFNLEGNITINQICFERSDKRVGGVNTFDVTFQRPQLEPKLFLDNTEADSDINQITIVLKSARNASLKGISVSRTGQIAVVAAENIKCPAQ